MMTPFDIEAGIKVQFNTWKDSKAMTSNKLFSYCKPHGAMIREIEGLLNR